jgi:short-subunit dehydrogenase
VTAVCPGVINTPIIDTTRFLGDQDDPKVRRRTTKLFRRGHKPEAVADAIVKAVERNRAVVPVGFEAWLGWWMHRYVPLRAQEAIGRLGRR